MSNFLAGAFILASVAGIVAVLVVLAIHHPVPSWLASATAALLLWTGGLIHGTINSDRK